MFTSYLTSTMPAKRWASFLQVYIVLTFAQLNTDILEKQPQKICNFPASSKGKARNRAREWKEDIESSQKNLCSVTGKRNSCGNSRTGFALVSTVTK